MKHVKGAAVSRTILAEVNIASLPEGRPKMTYTLSSRLASCRRYRRNRQPASTILANTPLFAFSLAVFSGLGSKSAGLLPFRRLPAQLRTPRRWGTKAGKVAERQDGERRKSKHTRNTKADPAAPRTLALQRAPPQSSWRSARLTLKRKEKRKKRHHS